MEHALRLGRKIVGEMMMIMMMLTTTESRNQQQVIRDRNTLCVLLCLHVDVVCYRYFKVVLRKKCCPKFTAHLLHNSRACNSYGVFNRRFRFETLAIPLAPLELWSQLFRLKAIAIQFETDDRLKNVHQTHV